MNAISFSLYGNEPKYCIGAVKNVILAKRFYPDWKCIFWIDDTVPSDVRACLIRHGAELRIAEIANLFGCFWRFMVNDIPEVKRYIVRDTDSRISERELVAVNAWIESGRKFHTIRDHPAHSNPIMGGMWGAVKGAIPSMRKLIEDWDGIKFGYDSDQQFLRDKVWPLVKKYALQHDTCCRGSFPGSKPLPSPLSYKNLRFVGEVFDEHDKPRAYDWEMLMNYV